VGFQWTERQFVAGALCLDFANTVIYPTDPVRRVDRLVGLADLDRWIASALRYGPLKDDIARAIVAAPELGDEAGLSGARACRDATDRLFRAAAVGSGGDQAYLRQVIGAYQEAVAVASFRFGEEGLDLAPRPGSTRIDGLLVAISQSAMSLLLSPEVGRIKACPSCDWLFVDRSNSRRRRWCDMRSCGNRAKAKRHYDQRRGA